MDKSGMDKFVSVNKDAFSSGQISSKLWLCEKLEAVPFSKPQVIWIYGGWYGILSFLLLSRQRVPIKHIRSFDIDPTCQPIADALLENWVWQEWKFKAFTSDCNTMSFADERPDIVINCSTEHFTCDDWFKSIPTGTMLVIQSNNMQHDDHHSCVSDADHLHRIFPLSQVIYKGNMDFVYPDWQFSRFMIIGRKT